MYCGIWVHEFNYTCKRAPTPFWVEKALNTIRVIDERHALFSVGPARRTVLSTLDPSRRDAHSARYTGGRAADEAPHGVVGEGAMPETDHGDSSGYVPGRTLVDGERVVLARVANQDTLDRGVVSLELTITDRQASVAVGRAPETGTCRRTRRPGYALVDAQVVWGGLRFAQDRQGGGFREVEGVDGNFRAEGRTLPPTWWRACWRRSASATPWGARSRYLGSTPGPRHASAVTPRSCCHASGSRNSGAVAGRLRPASPRRYARARRSHCLIL